MSVSCEQDFSWVLAPPQYFTFFYLKALLNRKNKVIFVISVLDWIEWYIFQEENEKCWEVKTGKEWSKNRENLGNFLKNLRKFYLVFKKHLTNVALTLLWMNDRTMQNLAVFLCTVSKWITNRQTNFLLYIYIEVNTCIGDAAIRLGKAWKWEERMWSIPWKK